jgi:biotin operon repressor
VPDKTRPVVGKLPVSRTFLWLKQVNRDHDLAPNAFRVGFEISQLINNATNTAWPSQTYLAEVLGLSRRSVQNAIEQLVERNHLQLVSSGKGRGRSNHYRLFIKARMKPERGAENA